jgi:hypothetical protein
LAAIGRAEHYHRAERDFEITIVARDAGLTVALPTIAPMMLTGHKKQKRPPRFQSRWSLSSSAEARSLSID